MDVDQRIAQGGLPPQEGETLYSPEQHRTYRITKAYGEIPHTLLGVKLSDYAYEARWEDGIDQRMSIVQMRYDEYRGEGAVHGQ